MQLASLSLPAPAWSTTTGTRENNRLTGMIAQIIASASWPRKVRPRVRTSYRHAHLSLILLRVLERGEADDRGKQRPGGIEGAHATDLG
jgi:hypothetical protein